MEYRALYRRWRPRGFLDFVGQAHVITTLMHAIESDRVAHAYLFAGPRGTGKTSTAKIFAKALNCESPQGAEPCDQCSNCQRINEGIFMDVLEIDGASNRGIDEIRELREKIKFSPAEGKFKIYIIDEVHMLTMEAFNALLKTLEEPPSFVVFILATTEVHKLPLTILSRCQRFDFKRFTPEEIHGRLQTILSAEGYEADEGALNLIARHAEGGMRDALSLLEQCLAHTRERLGEKDVRAILGLIDQEVIEKMAEAITKGQTETVLKILKDVTLDGKDLFQFGQGMVDYFRTELLDRLSGARSGPLSIEALVRLIEILAAAAQDVKKSFQNGLPLELALIKLTTSQWHEEDLAARVARLEQTLEKLTHADSQAPLTAVPSKPTWPAVDSAPERSAPKAVAGGLLQKASPVHRQAEMDSSAFDWEGFLEAVKERKRTVGALIQEGKAVYFDGRELRVEFPPHLKFHIENLALPHNRELLENILQQLLGREIRISCVPQESNPRTETAATGTRRQENPDVLQQAVALFGGTVKPIHKEE